MAKAYTNEEYLAILVSKGIVDITPMEPYTKSKVAINHKCSFCDTIWATTPNKILAGRKCPSCSNKRKDYSLVVSSEYEVLEPYINNYTPISHKHVICGTIWKVRPSSILYRDTNCPSCSSTGFNYSKPAILYLVKFIYEDEEYHKIGITGRNVKERIGSDWNKFNFSIVNIETYAKGVDAYIAEQAFIKNNNSFKVNPKCLKSGNTEVFKFGVCPDRLRE